MKKSDNTLIKAEYNGNTLYFTTKGKCATAFGVENASVDYSFRKGRLLKNKWKLSEESNCENIPYGEINPTFEDVLKNISN